MHTLNLTTAALALLSDILDVNDDDQELADNSGAELEIINELRGVVAAALGTAPSGEFGDHIRVSRRFSAGGFNPAIPGDFAGLVPQHGSATGPHIHLDTQVPSCASRVKTWLMRRRFEDDEN